MEAPSGSLLVMTSLRHTRHSTVQFGISPLSLSPLLLYTDRRYPNDGIQGKRETLSRLNHIIYRLVFLWHPLRHQVSSATSLSELWRLRHLKPSEEVCWGSLRPSEIPTYSDDNASVEFPADISRLRGWQTLHSCSTCTAVNWHSLRLNSKTRTY